MSTNESGALPGSGAPNSGMKKLDLLNSYTYYSAFFTNSKFFFNTLFEHNGLAWQLIKRLPVQTKHSKNYVLWRFN